MHKGTGLMRLVPWRAIEWACDRFGLCWVSCVSLKMFGLREWWCDHDGSKLRDLKPTTMCFEAHPEPHDYCGMYGSEHPCFKAVVARRAALDREAQPPAQSE